MSRSQFTKQASKGERRHPEIRPGHTVRVHQKVSEGDKERIQIFEGLVIGVHKGHVPSDANFTVRRIASGVGVEKIFPIHSPLIEKIEVKKIAKVRRAKLNFLRGRSGKKARISERFTHAEEFSIAAAPSPVVEATVEQPAEMSKVGQEAVEKAEKKAGKEE